MKLTPKQQRFVDEYLKCENVTQAAINAGYKKVNARRAGSKNMSKAHIRKAIDERMAEIASPRIADIKEILSFYTSALRGEIDEDVVVTEGSGDGESKARVVKKQISARDRLKAADSLLKRYPTQMDTEEQQLRIAKAKAEVDELQQNTSKDDIVFTFDRKAVQDD